MKTVKEISLYYREGSSDKVYKIALVDENGKFSVNFAYGRRGNTLTTGTKVHDVALHVAQNTYEKLIREKTSKGYVEDPSAKPFSNSQIVNKEDTGVRPQLLNDIEEEDVQKYIDDDNYCMQEKYDGRRRLIIKDGDYCGGANRKGLEVELTDQIAEAVNTKLPKGNYALDGEAVGEHVRIFDVLLPDMSYKERFSRLQFILRGIGDCEYIKLTSVAWTKEDKQELYDKLKKENAEGVVFKNIHAHYTPGRPNSGGDQLKFKFYTTASCVVSGVNEKRSVSLVVFDENNTGIPVGNVTVYPNQEIPEVGAVVEIRYLYYFPGGALFQPQLIVERDDIDISECNLSKLKIKREEEVES